jgi:hypothetical protein
VRRRPRRQRVDDGGVQLQSPRSPLRGLARKTGFFDELAAATLTRDNLTNANAVNLSAGSRHQPQLCRLGGRRLRTS